MELREYWAIVRRRWWLAPLLGLLAFVGSWVGLFFFPQTTGGYQATVKLAVRPQWTLSAYTPRDEYYAYVSSEYLNDDMIEVLQSGAFLQALQARYRTSDGRPPQGSIRAKKAHRVITATVTADRREDALLIAQGLAEMLAERPSGEPSSPYFARLSVQNPVVTMVDPPTIVAEPVNRRTLVDVLIRTVVGLAVGVGLAFVLDYLDDTIRSAREVEQLTGFRVIGEIPAEPRRSVRSKRSARP